MSVDTNSIQIDQSWKEVLKDEFQKPYFSQIKEFLMQEKNNGKTIFPK
jgi:uracil-DNA glycosylase